MLDAAAFKPDQRFRVYYHRGIDGLNQEQNLDWRWQLPPGGK